MTVASIIINRFNEGLEPFSEAELLGALSGNPVSIEHSLHVLEEIGLISKTDDVPTRFLPTKSVNDCTLLEIWRALRSYDADPLDETTYSKDAEKVREFQVKLERLMENELGNRKFIDEPASSPD